MPALQDLMDPFEAAAYRTRQSVRPEGGRQDSGAADFVGSMLLPQSPIDYGLMALGGPLGRAAKVGALGLSALLEGTGEAEGGVLGKLIKGSGAVRGGTGVLSGEILPPAASTALPGVTNLQRAKLGPMLEQLEKLGATPEQIRTFTPVEAYKWIRDRQGTTLGSGGDKRTAATVQALQGIKAYHGSPHDFDKFDMSKIGTGEGAQAYGHGLYFAENEGVANSYKSIGDWFTFEGKPLQQVWREGRPNEQQARIFRALSMSDGSTTEALNKLGRADTPIAKADVARLEDWIKTGRLQPNKGRMYEVNIRANPEEFLDWDRPLAEQGQHVLAGVDKVYPNAINAEAQRSRSALAALQQKYPNSDPMGQQAALKRALEKSDAGGGLKGEELMRRLFMQPGATEASVAQGLRDAGIPGIRYLDQGSRGAGEGTSNYVLFRDDIIDILRKYGLAGTAGPLGALMYGQQTE